MNGMLTTGGVADVHLTFSEPPGHVTVTGFQAPQAQVSGKPVPPVDFGLILSIFMGMLQPAWQAAPPQEAVKRAL
jgi:hypothetical protein